MKKKTKEKIENDIDIEHNFNQYSIIFGEALILASIQFAIASVEQSSRFSIASFAKDQTTLDNAGDALQSYVTIALFWTLGSTLIMYGKYDGVGFFASIFANFFIIFWIVYTYQSMFRKIVKVNPSLTMPALFGIFVFA